MQATLHEIGTIDALDQALKESETRPVLVFKHSNACPISSRALSEFNSFLQTAGPEVAYHMVTVQIARSVSNEIESRLKVEHETPQAILVKNGRAVWDTSHYSITASSLRDAVKDNS